MRLKKLKWNKTRKFILLCLSLPAMFYITLLGEIQYSSTVPRLWLRDANVDIGKLLDDTVKIGSDFMTSKSNAHYLDSYARSMESVYSRIGVSCPHIFKGSQQEIQKSRELLNSRSGSTDFYELTSNCPEFVKRRGYMTMPESEEEASFPIAYNILVYTDYQLAERLLRAIYAPQNFYCIHVDAKANEEVKRVLRSIADCLPNVFLPKRMIPVSWGHISIMQAEIICMEELLEFKWKYFINLSGRMFPLMSNSELVRVLKLFKGANDIDGSHKRAMKIILHLRQLFRWYHSNLLDLNVLSLLPKSSPPHNVILYTGSNQAILSRAFVVYFLYSKVSQDLIDWFSNTLVPDEYIWSTLNHNPHLGAPGGYLGDAEKKMSIARFSLWQIANPPWECQGFFQREICIFGIGDLNWLIQQPHLFANKFHSNFEWLAIDCMEEMIFNRTINALYEKANHTKLRDAVPNLQLNMSYYESLAFIANNSFITSLKNSALSKYCQHR